MLRLKQVSAPTSIRPFCLILSVHTARAQNFTGSVRGTLPTRKGLLWQALM